MKRPGPVASLFGNPLSVLTLLGTLGYSAYQCWSNGWSLWTPLIALLVASYGLRASDEIAKFNRWQREWQAMDGGTPRATLWRFAPSLRTLAIVAGIGFLIYLVVTMPNTPDMQVAKGAVMLALAIALLARVIWFFRGRWRSHSAMLSLTVDKDVPVTLCVRPARYSSNLATAYHQLPEYCMGLISNQKR